MIQLIPQAYINEACFVSLNLDEKKFNMTLKLAQEDLEDVLGGEFYEEIESQYDADTLTADNDALYEDFLKDFLAWQTYFHFLKWANVEVTPTGVREFTEEHSTIASDVKMYSLEKNVKDRADKYKFKTINYLNLEKSKDSTKFPLWEDKCREERSFSITAIDKTSDALINVNKSITTNE